ncbi:unnamed protein product [Fraxinus pennsylvanica]|uniref:NAC domain-containing protein n=1 Tax=Fraxinus pennsylvanica TaxID=56036 RepID=A0AAD2AFS2_9LAMI|nr:unnamed protein product [Fraxinus pennsylvanica]
MNHQQEEEDESRHLLIQSLIDNDTTHHGLWEERHQNYPVRRYEQHGLLNRNTVPYNANNPHQLQNIHQQNQGLLQVDRNMVVDNMNHHVQRHRGLQQNLVHQNTAVQGINIQQQYQNFNQPWYTRLNNTTTSSQQQQNHVPIQQFPQNQHNLLMSNNAAVVPPNGENIIRNLPAGYRFVPSDEELVNKYLKNKVENKPLPCNGLIHDVQIYDSNPYELIGMFLSEYNA